RVRVEDEHRLAAALRRGEQEEVGQVQARIVTRELEHGCAEVVGHADLPHATVRTTLPGPWLPDLAAPPSSSGKRPSAAATSAMPEAATASASGKVAAMVGTSLPSAARSARQAMPTWSASTMTPAMRTPRSAAVSAICARVDGWVDTRMPPGLRTSRARTG